MESKESKILAIMADMNVTKESYELGIIDAETYKDYLTSISREIQSIRLGTDEWTRRY